MAEAVGLAASVLGLAQTGWSVAKGLHDLAEEVSSAGEAVRIFANDFWLFMETVETLGDLSDSLPPMSGRIQSTTEELIDVAMEQVVKPFQHMIIELEPLLVKWRDSPNRMMQLGLRLQWAFSHKRRVLFYHSALNALKGNVSLLLQAMTLRGQNPPHIHFILCRSIEDTKTLLQNSTRIQVSRVSIFQQGGTVDRRLLSPDSEKASKAHSTTVAISPWGKNKSQDRHQPSTETAIVRVTDAENSDDAYEITESLTGIALLEPDHMNDSEQDQEETEEQLESLGAIRAVQKKVIKLATEATSSAAESAPDQTDTATGSNDSPSRASTASGATSQPPERILSQELPNLAARPKQTDKHVAGWFTTAPPPAVAQASESPEKGDDMIHFRDSLASTFEIPYKLIRTWPAMHAFLVAAYGQVTAPALSASLPIDRGRDDQRLLSRLQSAVHRDQFSILHVDAPSRIILLHEWERRVQPGWRLQLRLDDDGLEGVKLVGYRTTPSFKTMRLAQMAAAQAGAGPGSRRRRLQAIFRGERVRD